MTGPDGTVHMKHVFFDTGDGSYVSFMCPTPDMPNHPEKWATDINSGLGVMNGAYHFAFWANSVEELEAQQARLRAHSHPVTEIIDPRMVQIDLLPGTRRSHAGILCHYPEVYRG